MSFHLRTIGRFKSLCLANLVALLFLPSLPLAQESADFFRQNCSSCHTIGGGRLTGPDLKEVTARKNRAWLIEFIQNPKMKIDSGDPYAQKLFQDSRGVLMPVVSGMGPALAARLLDLIDAESKLEKSQFVGLQISDAPFTSVDIAKGYRLFVGTQGLISGGPSCISCHTVKDMGFITGGRLGPDLTLVYERLQGRKGLSSWLFAPATVTMRSVFRAHGLQPDEILALTAYLEDATKKGGKDTQASLLNFFLFGLGGAVVGLVSFNIVWKRRFHGVRKPLIHNYGIGSKE